MAKEGPDDEALLGRTIAGKFAIDSYVGGGAMGAVYKAKQFALDKIVAIKVMHRDIAKDEKFVARFKREAKAASKLDHPNSLRIIDFGEEPDGLLYIAMEYPRRARSLQPCSRRRGPCATSASSTSCSRRSPRSPSRTTWASCTATSSPRTS